jgi:Protein of unknown function (DUF2892)
MRRNIGITQRLVRLIAGLACLGLYGVLTPPWQYLALLGLIPLSGALTGFRPERGSLGQNPWRSRAGGGSSNGSRTRPDGPARRRRYPPRVPSGIPDELAPRGRRTLRLPPEPSALRSIGRSDDARGA